MNQASKPYQTSRESGGAVFWFLLAFRKDRPTRPMSKRVEQWNRVRKRLIGEFRDKGITTCEMKLEGCMRTFGLSFAHRQKRRFYKTDEKLGDFNEVCLACAHCHQATEYDRELTEKIFKKIR